MRYVSLSFLRCYCQTVIDVDCSFADSFRGFLYRMLISLSISKSRCYESLLSWSLTNIVVKPDSCNVIFTFNFGKTKSSTEIRDVLYCFSVNVLFY